MFVHSKLVNVSVRIDVHIVENAYLVSVSRLVMLKLIQQTVTHYKLIRVKIDLKIISNIFSIYLDFNEISKDCKNVRVKFKKFKIGNMNTNMNMNNLEMSKLRRKGEKNIFAKHPRSYGNNRDQICRYCSSVK